MTSEDIKLAITIGAFFISLGGLVWKMSALNSQVKENSRDVNGVGKKIMEIKNQQIEALAKLTVKIENIEQTLVKVTTSIEFIVKQLEEVKKK